MLYFKINNRRYTGSKFKLLDWIKNIIEEQTQKSNTFCDLFAGTGCVAEKFNEATFYKQQRLVHWCNAHDQGNYRSIHSDEYKRKTSKKYEYY
jgi:adenine-specific DNA methylase